MLHPEMSQIVDGATGGVITVTVRSGDAEKIYNLLLHHAETLHAADNGRKHKRHTDDIGSLLRVAMRITQALHRDEEPTA